MEDGSDVRKPGEISEVIEHSEFEQLMPGVELNKVVKCEGCTIPEFRQWVRFAWSGKTESGDKFCKRREAWAKLGDGDIPPGIELGIRTLGVGEQGILKCGSRFAFGDMGRPIRSSVDLMVLPPDTDVEIDLEVLELGSALQVGAMSDIERIEECRRKKQIGNECFEYMDFQRSTRAYSAALKAVDGLLEEQTQGTEEDSVNDLDTIVSKELSSMTRKEKFELVLKLMIDCGCNIAAAYLKLKDYSKAESSCVAVLQVDANNAKALYRGGVASMYQHKFEEANLAFKTLLELNPDNKEALTKFKELKKRENAYKDKERQMAKKMGANLFSKPSSPATPSNSQKENSEIPSQEPIDPAKKIDTVSEPETESQVSEETPSKVMFTWQTYVYMVTLAVLLVAIGASLIQNQ